MRRKAIRSPSPTASRARHVELDAETGFVKILKHWVVEDCGGSSIRCWSTSRFVAGWCRGLAQRFFEECLYSESGQLTNGSLADYLVPMAGEMPDIEIAHVETPTLDTQLGAKGCGEAGTAAASAAALNAVNDAMPRSARDRPAADDAGANSEGPWTHLRKPAQTSQAHIGGGNDDEYDTDYRLSAKSPAAALLAGVGARRKLSRNAGHPRARRTRRSASAFRRH